MSNASAFSAFLTIDEAAARLRVSKSYLYKKTASHNVPHYRIGRRVFFDPDELDQWALRQSRVEAV